MGKSFKTDGVASDTQFGVNGPRIVANGQILEHRDSAGALTRAKAAPGIASDDVAVVSQLGGGGGSSFGMFNPLVSPLSPNPIDVDTWTDLPSGWSAWTPGATGPALSQTRSIDRGALIMDIGSKPANSGAACTGVYRAIPADSEWAAYCRLSLLGPRTAAGVFVECGFGIAEDLAGSPNSSWLRMCDTFQEDSASLETVVRSMGLSSFSSGTSPYLGAPPALQFSGSFWFRIRKTNPSSLTDYSADYSTDGIRWQTLHNVTIPVPAGGPQNLVIYARSTPSTTNPAPEFRVVVGPLRVATGSASRNITSLIPAGT